MTEKCNSMDGITSTMENSTAQSCASLHCSADEAHHRGPFLPLDAILPQADVAKMQLAAKSCNEATNSGVTCKCSHIFSGLEKLFLFPNFAAVI